MDEVLLISSMAMLVVLAAFFSIVMSRLKFPPLVGFLVAGILIANFLKMEEDAMDVVETFSKLGLIMLMFSIGMEIDVRKLRNQGKFALIVALVQLPLMVAGGVLAGLLLGYNMLQSICLGAIISGSSTAVVLAVLKAQGSLDKEHIETLILVVIMEDIGQVIMLSMLTPMLSGSEMSGDALIMLILQIAVFMIACFTLGLFLVPRIIDWFYKRSNDELISLLCIGSAFALAWAATKMGLDIAIGAFLMGVIVGTSRPRKAVEHFVDPLKSLFMAMFFISVGMEVSLNDLAGNVGLILIIFAVFAVCKFAFVYLGYWVGNGDSRVGFIASISLCAMGEFAFIIAKQALDAGVYTQSLYSSVIGAAMVSMIVLPIIGKYSERSYDKITTHMPKPIGSIIDALNRIRDGIYSALSEISSMAKKSFTRGLASIYFLIFLVIIIEAIFYLIYDPMSWWMSNNLGLSERICRALMVGLNFVILFYPLKRIMDSVRLILHILSMGKKKQNQNMDSEDIELAETLNPMILAGIVDILIIILTPNKLDTVDHLIVGTILIALMVLYQVWKTKTGRKGSSLPSFDEDETA